MKHLFKVLVMNQCSWRPSQESILTEPRKLKSIVIVSSKIRNGQLKRSDFKRLS